MKATAQEKLYFNQHTAQYNHERRNDDDIEYTRSDAFIEKACEFFEENIEEEDCKIGNSEWTELRAEYKSLNSFIIAFIKYMEGE